jgi:hypothetical protein
MTMSDRWLLLSACLMGLFGWIARRQKRKTWPMTSRENTNALSWMWSPKKK